MERENPSKNNVRKHLFRSFAPFLFFLVGAITANYVIEDLRSAQLDASVGLAVTATPDQDLSIQGEATRAPIATAVPFMSPTSMELQGPTAKPQPTRISDRVAHLLGPPDQSMFSEDARVTFYWQATQALEEGQAFALYLVSTDNEWRLASIAEPNLGQFFQTSLPVEEIELPDGIYGWEVRLVDTESGAVTGRSESRELGLLTPAE